MPWAAIAGASVFGALPDGGAPAFGGLSDGASSVSGGLPDGGSSVSGGLPMAVPLYLVSIEALYTYGEITVTFNSVLPSRPSDVRSLYQRVLSNRGAVLLRGPGFNDTVIPTCACGLVRYGRSVRTDHYFYANRS